MSILSVIISSLQNNHCGGRFYFLEKICGYSRNQVIYSSCKLASYVIEISLFLPCWPTQRGKNIENIFGN